jgi:hypothetical protein
MISVSVTPDNRTATAVLTITGHSGAVTITATPDRGPAYTVRQTGTGSPPSLVVVDYEVPLRTRVYYSVVDAADNVGAVVLDEVAVDGCVLSSTFTPTNSTTVRVVEDAPHSLEARSAWYDVIGRRDPLVSVDVMRYRSGSLSLYVRGNAQRSAVLSLFYPGDPLLLRTSLPERVDDMIFLPLNVDEDPAVDNTGGRVFSIDYQAVTRPIGPHPGSTVWTYTALASFVAAYVDVLSAFPTYAALVLGPLTEAAVLPSAPSPASWTLVL